MKINLYKKWIIMTLCSIWGAISHADTAGLVNQQLIPMNDVKVYVNRALKSQDGAYLLQLYSGIWDPHGTLYDIVKHDSLSFEGSQKGNKITLSSFDPEIGEQARGAFRLTGDLNNNTGIYQAKLISKDPVIQNDIIFIPLVEVLDRPKFLFNFYGVYLKKEHSNVITQIDILDKETKKIYQRLTGFIAYGYSATYVDVNYDGYFDLVLADVSGDLDITDNHYIYWMYNPKTKKFQRSPQLDGKGYPTLYIDQSEVNFSEGYIYKVKNGKFYKIDNK